MAFKKFQIFLKKIKNICARFEWFIFCICNISKVECVITLMTQNDITFLFLQHFEVTLFLFVKKYCSSIKALPFLVCQEEGLDRLYYSKKGNVLCLHYCCDYIICFLEKRNRFSRTFTHFHIWIQFFCFIIFLFWFYLFGFCKFEILKARTWHLTSCWRLPCLSLFSLWVSEPKNPYLEWREEVSGARFWEILFKVIGMGK